MGMAMDITATGGIMAVMALLLCMVAVVTIEPARSEQGRPSSAEIFVVGHSGHSLQLFAVSRLTFAF
jgi:hypothetical protein